MSRNLVIIGILLIVIGIFWPWMQKIPVGRLPGDIVIRRDNFSLYLPIATCVVISLIVSFLFWLFRK